MATERENRIRNEEQVLKNEEFWKEVEKKLPDDPEIQESYANFVTGHAVENDDNSDQAFWKWLVEQIQSDFANGASLNVKRYRELMVAKMELDEIAKKIDETTVFVEQDEIDPSLFTLTIRTTYAFEFYRETYRGFMHAISLADHFGIEFYPEAGTSDDQYYQIVFTFGGVFDPIK